MKKIHLFILFQLIWISQLVVGYSRSNISNSKSQARTDSINITIKSGNIKNGKLILDHTGTVDVYRGTVVTWNVDPSSNVKYFLIEKKGSSKEIFNIHNPPPGNYTGRGSGKVDENAVLNREFSYTIYWITNPFDNHIYRFDPKLAVKPN